MYEGRACYLSEWPGEESYTIPVPIFDDTVGSPPTSHENKELTMEGLFDEMEAIEDHFLNIPPFEILRTYFIDPEVCPTALIDSYLVFLIEAEQAVREYHTLPFPGGLWDQPLKLLEAFTTIRYERNQYERIRIEVMRAKSKKSTARPGTEVLPESTAGHLPPRRRNVE